MDKKKLLLRILVILLSVVLVVMVVGVAAVNYILGQIGSELPEDTIPWIPPELADDETDPPPDDWGPSDDPSDPSDAPSDPSNDPSDPSNDPSDPSNDPTGSTDGTTDTTPPPTTVPPTTEIQITWPEVEQLYNENIINIMLIGHDARSETERARSDTMILLSINKANNTITMTSFMRDLYVQIPGGYLDNRLNAAYRFGGATLLDATIQKNFGITVNGNVAVNFNQFETIVNVLGGVDVELTSAEANHLNSEGYGPLQTGMNHLDGRQALAFSRIRKIDSDHQRTERQRRILTAIANSIKGAGIGELMGLMNEVLPYVDTDLTDSQIVSYTTSALSILAGGTIQSGKVPQPGQYQSLYIRNMSVMVPDLIKCSQYLKDLIYNA